MKDIISIVIRLVVTCLLAATVMGFTFIFTSNAKKHNEHAREQQVMFKLMGFEDKASIPDTVAMHELYRYVVTGQESQSIAYLIPAGHGEDGGFTFVNIDLAGKMLETKQVTLSEADSRESELRDKAMADAAGAGFTVEFADQTVVISDDGNRIAYLLSGKFQGFKTFINVMLAVDPDFSMIGLEILEHEEDPGLGAEIEKDYFKNQFKGKSFEWLKNVQVIKEPIPTEYLAALNGKVSEDDIMKLRAQYTDQDIYALTGATISTKAVSNGVKGIVKKFAYRVTILDKVLKEQQLAVSF